MGNIVAVKSKLKGRAYWLISLDTFDVRLVLKNKDTAEQEKKLDEYIGTAVFINKEYDACGYLKERKNGTIGLYWVKMSNALKEKDKLLNIDGKLIDITDKGRNGFTPKFFKSLNKNFAGALYFSNDLHTTINIGVEKFLGIESTEEKPIEEESEAPVETEQTSEEKDQPEEKEVGTPTNNEDPYKEYKDWLENQLNNYYNTRKVVEDAEKEKAKAKEVSLQALKLLSLVKSDSLETISDAILNISDIACMDEPTMQEDENNTSDMVYELMLKSIKENDSISISFDYYKKLKTTLKKTLSNNMALTKYTALVEIKLNVNDAKHLLVIVDYDESIESIRITVLKPYNSVKIDDSKLVYYEMKYRKWKKDHGYINS